MESGEETLENEVGMITPQNIVRLMLQSKHHWAQIAQYKEHSKANEGRRKSVSYTHLDVYKRQTEGLVNNMVNFIKLLMKASTL